MFIILHEELPVRMIIGPDLLSKLHLANFTAEILSLMRRSYQTDK